MGRTTGNLTIEQQEMLDSGLRMLAHMIAETHLRRIALRRKIEYTIPSSELTERSDQSRGMLGEYYAEHQSESCHE